MTKTKTQLPDKLSELLRVALVDLEKCELSKEYRVLMHEWHAPRGDTCAVCFAGAVMAQTLQIPRKKHINHHGSSFETPFDEETTRKLKALNCLRCGCIGLACDDIEADQPEGVERIRTVTQYETNPEQFKADMRKLADDLEAAGL